MYYICFTFKIIPLEALLEQIKTENNSSIKVKTYVQSLIDVPLHYHPENEIVYIQKGSGSLFVGDTEENFDQGDLFFISGNVPHLFHNSAKHNPHRNNSKVSVVQYAQSLFNNFQLIPEFDAINQFQSTIRFGVKLKATATMKNLFGKLEKANSLFRFNYLTELLHHILSQHDFQLLGNNSTQHPSNQVAYIRLMKIKSFLAGYSFRDITIGEAASVIHMNKTSFCRFLKRETGMTFSEHLNLLRINHACKLLLETDMSVMDICYSTGYTNPAYFFRKFKKIRKTTPGLYREKQTS